MRERHDYTPAWVKAIKPKSRRCKNCHAELRRAGGFLFRPQAVYCSNACRQDAYRRRLGIPKRERRADQ